SPGEHIRYLEKNYLGEETLKLWSAVFCKDRTIFKLCDTNMVVEAYVCSGWHHILKGGHMESKQNRCVDQLIHVLINVALPSYIVKH
ncbi:hypothetical protein C8R44DRAFT_587722, partial [Mycena epipterygia]